MNKNKKENTHFMDNHDEANNTIDIIMFSNPYIGNIMFNIKFCYIYSKLTN
jgi:hypothetical protein